MRRPSTFKKADLTRAARGVLAAGLDIARVEVSRVGAIVIVPVQAAGACNPVPPNAGNRVCSEPRNISSVPAGDLDRELSEFNERRCV